MYNVFELELQFRDRIFGGLPTSEDQLMSYIKQLTKPEEPTAEDVENLGKDLDLDNEEDKAVLGFRRDEKGLYLGSYQLKAMLAQSASLLEITTKKRGSKQTLREAMSAVGLDDEGTATGDKIYFLPMRKEADGEQVHTGNVSGPQGNRSIVKVMEYVEKPRVKFQLRLLMNRMDEASSSKKFSTIDLKKSLAVGRESGLGSHRRFEAGKFDVLNFKQLDPLNVEDVIDF